ncbi:MAG: OmpA family protein [Gemmatimonadota bacterium]
MTQATRIGALAFLSLAMVAACKKTPETAAVPVTNGAAPSETCNQACRDSIADAARRRATEDSIRRAEAARTEAARARAATVATLQQVILFDYDQADILSQARALLEAKLPILRANSTVRIRISGHADERGSDEYNLALGQRRAAAAKRFLTDNGIDGGRIDIISFGEERPAATDGTESAFSLNRRAEFEIVAGVESIVPAR